jgi:hypothetical protein
MLLSSLLALALATPIAQDPLGDVPVVKTKHYELHLDMDEARREEWTELAEAAWKLYAKELGDKPRSKPGKKLVVRFYSDRDDWLAGMEREEEFPLPGVNFVHHAPDRDTLFLHDEHDRYHARKMYLYGLFLQFHHGLKAKNQYLGKEWFITGMADATSTHVWTGKKLELGARRLLTTENRSSLALARGLMGRISDGVLSLEDMSDWDVRWALTAYLLHGDERAHRETFMTMALGKQGSMLLGVDFLANIGDVKEITARMESWVLERSHAFEPVFGRWTQLGSGLQAASSEGQEFAIALAAPGWTTVGAQVTAGVQAAPGLVLDWESGASCTLALVSGEVLRVLRLEGGDVEELDSASIQRKKPLRLEARVVGEEAVLALDGGELARYPCHSQRLGLAVQKGASLLQAVRGE